MDGERDIILVEMGSRECLFVCERERERESEFVRMDHLKTEHGYVGR